MSKQIATILSLKDKISQPLTKVSKNVGKVTRDMKHSQNQIEKWKNKSVKAIDNVIKKTAKFAVATGAIAGAIVVKVGFEGLKELDEGAAKVKSIAKDSLELKNIQKELLKTSTKTGIVVNELAETQYSAISSGIKASESVQASIQASKLAKAGFTDVNSALKIMASTMNVYGVSGTKAMEAISDKLLITQNLGVTTVAELAESLGTLTPVANSAGASIDELMAGMAALTKNGLKTEEAVTAFKGILTSVIKPTSESAKMAKQLGIDFSVSAIKSKGMAAFLEDIKEKTRGNTEVMGKLFGNVRALSGALVLTGKGGIGDFNKALDAMENSAGATEEAYATMTNTIGFKLDKFKNTSKNTFTSIMNTQSGLIGEYVDKIDSWFTNNEEKIQDWIQAVGEGITKMIEFVKGVVDFIKRHEKLITTVFVFIGTMYGVIKVIGIAKTVLTALKTVWMIFNGTLLVSPLGWVVLVIGAVVAAGYLLYRNWDLIKEKAGLLWEGIKTAFAPLGGFFKNLWDGVSEGFRAFVNFFIDGINKVTGGISNIKVNIPDWVPKFGGKSLGLSIPKIPSFEKGTSYSPAGYARIHEKGGEIRKLSSGETIIPADKSERLLKNKFIEGAKIEINIHGNIYGEDDLINKVGSTVYKKVKLALDNI